MAGITRLKSDWQKQHGLTEWGERAFIPGTMDDEIVETNQNFSPGSIDISKIKNLVVDTIVATSGTIGGFDIGSDYLRDTANSFGLASTVTGGNDVRFWAGDTYANRATAPLVLYENGAAVFKSVTLSDSVSLNGLITGSEPAIQGWQLTSVFSPLSTYEVQWSSGSLILLDGTTYAISSGLVDMDINTTYYVYFDKNASTTVLQSTKVATDAVGSGKILLATTRPTYVSGKTAIYNTFGGATYNPSFYVSGSENIIARTITATEIVANTITANEIAANTITAGEIFAGTITATEIAATTITGANINTLNISGKTATFDTGTIGGFTMSGTTLSATNFSVISGAANTARLQVGTGATAGGINSANAGGDIVHWAGSTHANRATAPFRVDAAGNVTMISATIGDNTVTELNAVNLAFHVCAAISSPAIGLLGSTLFAAYSDAATPLISISGNDATANNKQMWSSYKIATDFGVAPYLATATAGTVAVSASFAGMMVIGTDDWDCRSSDAIRKNNGAVTIVGGATPHFGLLGHDPTATYLLILTSSTTVKRYSGISGTTITYVDTITLDTAVNTSKGFFFEDTNNRYICVDTTNSVIRRFNSSGTTVDTVAYTIDITKVTGLAMINDRVYMVIASGAGGDSGVAGSAGAQVINADLLPTTMTRE